jgi:hypothetical protein
VNCHIRRSNHCMSRNATSCRLCNRHMDIALPGRGLLGNDGFGYLNPKSVREAPDRHAVAVSSRVLPLGGVPVNVPSMSGFSDVRQWPILTRCSQSR